MLKKIPAACKCSNSLPVFHRLVLQVYGSVDLFEWFQNIFFTSPKKNIFLLFCRVQLPHKTSKILFVLQLLHRVICLLCYWNRFNIFFNFLSLCTDHLLHTFFFPHILSSLMMTVASVEKCVGSSALQVHGHAGIPGGVWQHPWPGEQAAPAVSPTPKSDAGHRVWDEGLDLRVPAPIPQPPLELQHHSQGPQFVWTPAATQWVEGHKSYFTFYKCSILSI